MKTFELQFDEPIASRLTQAADRLGLTPEELVRRTVEEKLARLDVEFDRAAKYVVDKNDELYRRLS